MVVIGTKWGFVSGTLVGIILGLPIFFVGALFGLVIGGVVGTIVGAFVGISAAVITNVFYFPPRHIMQYRIVIAMACSLVGLIGVNICSPSSWVPKVYDSLILVLAILSAILLSQKLANSYIKQWALENSTSQQYGIGE
jgi:hypothetical protein